MWFLRQQLPDLQGQMYNFLIRNTDANIYSRCWSNKMNMLLEAGDGYFGKLNKKQTDIVNEKANFIKKKLFLFWTSLSRKLSTQSSKFILTKW